MTNNKIICLVGASGSGKTTIAEAVQRDEVKVLPSYTTRPMRSPDETGHIFVDNFDEIRDELAAYTVFNGYEYGATHEQVDAHQIYVIDPSGVEYMQKTRPRDSFVVVWIHASEDARFSRMEKERGREKAKERIEHDREMYANIVGADYLLVNETDDDLGQCIIEMHALCKELFGRKEGE